MKTHFSEFGLTYFYQAGVGAFFCAVTVLTMFLFAAVQPRRPAYRSRQRQDSSGTAGMLFVAGLRRIFIDFAFPTRSFRGSCGTRTWQSLRSATSRRWIPTLPRRCSYLIGLSNMHLLCTSRVTCPLLSST